MNGRKRHSRPALSRRAPALFAGLAVTFLVLGAVGVASGSAGAQDPGDTKSIVVQAVDASGESVVVRGNAVGVDPVDMTAKVDGKAVDATTVGASDLPLDVVVVLDNSIGLGNATVQLAKQAIAPLLPGAGTVSRLGLVSTGGGSAVESGLTASDDQITRALSSIEPNGSSATWDGLVDAANVLDDARSETSQRVVVLFTAATAAGSNATPAQAETALRQSTAQLDAVYITRGVDVDALDGLIDNLGGLGVEVPSEEELDTGFEQVTTSLAGRFLMTIPPVAGNPEAAELTVSSGKTAETVSFVPGSVRTGSADLTPALGNSKGVVETVTSNSLFAWFVMIMGVAAVVIAVWTFLTMVLPSGDDLGRRLKVYEDPYGDEEDEPEVDSGHATVPILRRAVDFTGEVAQRRGVLEKLEGDLERANLPLRAAEAIFFAGAAGMLLGLLVFAMTRSIVMALVAIAVSIGLPRALLSQRVRSRQRAFVAQLPDMLSLMAGTLRAGYSIGQGFEAVSKEIEDPMGRELRRMVTENRLGRPLDEALESVADRMQSDDFAWAVMAIRIQREVGGNLAELLLTVADTMTQRERLRRDVATLTAEGRISALVLGLMPPALGMVMWVMNPEYIATLFTPGLGYILVGLALTSMAIGFAWMKKVITIEV